LEQRYYESCEMSAVLSVLRIPEPYLRVSPSTVRRRCSDKRKKNLKYAIFVAVKSVLRCLHGMALLLIFRRFRHYETSRKVAGSISNNIIGFFIFQPHYSAGVDSASNRNEYQEFSWGG
jgi:hypothetical protein